MIYIEYLISTVLFLTFTGLFIGLLVVAYCAVKLLSDMTKPTPTIKLMTPPNCKYKSQGGWAYNIYDTGCGKEFYDSTEDAVVTDWMTYCPYCGGKVE